MNTFGLALLSVNDLAPQGCIWLLDATLKGTALLAIAGMSLAVMRRASAAARQLVLWVTLAGLLLIPAFSAALPAWRVLPEWARLNTPPAASPDPRAPSPDHVPPTVTPAPQGPSLTTAVTPPSPAAPSAAISGGESTLRPLPASAPAPSAIWRRVSTCVMALWTLGVLAFLLPLAAGRLGLWRWRHSGRTVTSGPLFELLQQAQSHLGLSRRITLLVCPGRPMPMVWGAFHPTLLLPDQAAAWSPPRLRAVLLHELAHIQCHDLLTRILVQLACAAYWFNPLVWLAFQRFQTEAERACDDRVLAAGNDPGDYAQHLLELATGLHAGLFASHGALAVARTSKLEGRLTAILDHRRNRRTVTWRLAMGVLAVVMGMTTVLGTMRTRGATSSTGATGSAPTQPREKADAFVVYHWEPEYRGPWSQRPLQLLIGTIGPDGGVTLRTVASPDSRFTEPEGPVTVSGGKVLWQGTKQAVEVDLVTGKETHNDLPVENRVSSYNGNLPAVHGNQTAQWQRTNPRLQKRVRELLTQMATRPGAAPATAPTTTPDAIKLEPLALEADPEPALELLWSRNAGREAGKSAGGKLLEVPGRFFTGMMTEDFDPLPPIIWVDDAHVMTLFNRPDNRNYEVILVNVDTKQVTNLGKTEGLGFTNLVATTDDIGLTQNAGLGRADGSSMARLYAVSRTDALAGTGKLQQRPMQWGDFTLRGSVTFTPRLTSSYRGGGISAREFSCGGKDLGGGGDVMVSPDGKRAIWVSGYNSSERTSSLYYIDSQEKVVRELHTAAGFEMPAWTTATALGAGAAAATTRSATTRPLTPTLEAATAELRALFLKTAAENNAAVDRAATGEQHQPLSAMPGSGQVRLIQLGDLEVLAQQLNAGGRLQPTPELRTYAAAAAALLNDRDPASRGMACVFLGLLGTRTIELGRLPDLAAKWADTQPAANAIIESPVSQQATQATRMPPPKTTILSVGELAQMALGEATNLKFDTADYFRQWWKANSDYETHLWYWSSRWLHQNSAEEDLPHLFDRDPKAALSILLLASVNTSVSVEAHLPTVRHVYFSDPSPAAVAAQVAKYKLRPQLLNMVTGQFPADPPALPGYVRERLANSRALPILAAASTPADAAEIKALLQRAPGLIATSNSLQLNLAQLLAQLDPDHAADILRDQLQRNPGALWLAADLVKVSGTQEWATIKACYLERTSPGDGSGAAKLFEELTKLKNGDGPARLAELLQADHLDLELKDNDTPVPGNSINESRFLAFVKAAEILNGGKPVIDEQTVNQALVQVTKKMSADQLADNHAHNRAAVAARQEVVATVLKFFRNTPNRPM